MPVPMSIDQRIRVMVWQWAQSLIGVEDLQVLLRREGLAVPPRDYLVEIVRQAHEQHQRKSKGEAGLHGLPVSFETTEP